MTLPVERATLNPSKVLNEVYITLIIMSHPWKLTETLSKIDIYY